MGPDGTGDSHGKADNHHAQEEDDEWAPLSRAVGEVGKDNGKHRSCDVDWNCHQLGRA